MAEEIGSTVCGAERILPNAAGGLRVECTRDLADGHLSDGWHICRSPRRRAQWPVRHHQSCPAWKLCDTATGSYVIWCGRDAAHAGRHEGRILDMPVYWTVESPRPQAG